jgi:hypothetical protein
MKKANLILTTVLLLVLSFGAYAQTKTGGDYFTGKWSVLIKGLPDGNSKMVFLLEKKDKTMTGVVQDTTGVEISKISNAELSDNQVTVYFNAGGYDLNVLMVKKDEDHLTGSLIGMFDAVGDRVKNSK